MGNSNAVPLLRKECAQPQGARSVTQDIVLFAGAFVPVVLGTGPLQAFFLTGSMDTAVGYFRTPALWASILNSANWLIYSLVVAKKFDCIELILSYTMLLLLGFAFLLMAYGHKKCAWKGYVLNALAIPAIGFCFYSVTAKISLPSSMENYLGSVGLFLILFCHALQIHDIYNASTWQEKLVIALNLGPSLAINALTLWVTWVWHCDQFYILVSSVVNCVCYTMELMLLSMKLVQDHCMGGGGVGEVRDNGDDHARNSQPTDGRLLPNVSAPPVANTLIGRLLRNRSAPAAINPSAPPAPNEPSAEDRPVDPASGNQGHTLEGSHDATGVLLSGYQSSDIESGLGVTQHGIDGIDVSTNMNDESETNTLRKANGSQQGNSSAFFKWVSSRFSTHSKYVRSPRTGRQDGNILPRYAPVTDLRCGNFRRRRANARSTVLA